MIEVNFQHFIVDQYLIENFMITNLMLKVFKLFIIELWGYFKKIIQTLFKTLQMNFMIDFRILAMIVFKIKTQINYY